MVELAARICETPIAVINLIDEERQWFKAEVGLGVRETPLESSICAHAILQPGIFEVPDTLEDPRFQDNPLCFGEPHLRFYTGALLTSPEGQPLGTLCVLDHEPRRLTQLQKQTLAVLSRQVMAQIELRRALRHAELMMREIDHRVKNNLALVSGLLNLQSRRAKSPEVRVEVEAARDRIAAVAKLHEQLNQSSDVGAVDVRDFIERILAGTRETTGERVRIASQIAGVKIDSGRASLLGVLVNEMITNALRHAFPDGREGQVTIRFDASEDGSCSLAIEDDGVGMPEETNGSLGLGSMLLERLSGQLQATVHRERLQPGTRIMLHFAAPTS